MRLAIILALTTCCMAADGVAPTVDPVLNCAGYYRIVVGHFYNVMKERHDAEGLKANPDIQEPWRMVSEAWRQQERFWTVKPSAASLVFGRCRLVRDDELPMPWADDSTIPMLVVSEICDSRHLVPISKASDLVNLLDVRKPRPLALVLSFDPGNDVPTYRGAILPETLNTDAVVGMAAPMPNESQVDWTARVLADDPAAFKPR